MVRVIFTLDYEINGNGEGSSYDLMVEPTDRLLALFDRYGARLTIIKNAGHLPNIERPREFNAAVLPFLLEHRDAAV